MFKHLTLTIRMEPEAKKPKTITLKVTIPTQESIIDGLRQMFPMVEVEIEGEPEKEQEENSSDPLP